MNEYNGFNQISIKDKLKEIWYKYKKYIIISACIIIVLIVVLSIIFKQDRFDNTNLKYQSIETIMKLNAEKFVKNNNVTKDMYLSLNNLNLKIDNNLDCSSISGVLKENNNYYPYLVCKGYNSNTIKEILDSNESNKQYGTLKGDNPYILTSGEYVEEGYNINSKYTVNIKGNDIENGINIISYYILDNNQYVTELKRIVIAEDIQGNEPVIELTGNKTRTIPQNSLYKELGFTATDKLDGDITDKVQTIGTVDTSKPGTYIITYQVTNSRNKTTTAKRTVIVNQTEVTLDITHTINPTTVTGSEVTITLDIKGEGYHSTITPTNEEITTRNPSITVYKNGTYEFIIYDTNDNSEVYEVKITNIDSAPPTGSCEAIYENDKTIITVKATDISGIKSYEYINNSKSLTKNTKNSYSFNEYPTLPQVKVTDNSDETATISCKINNKSPKYYTSRFEFRKHSNGMRYYIYFPQNIDVREEVPLIIALHGGGGRHCAPIDGKYTHVTYDSWVTYPYLYTMIKEGNNYPAIVIFPERIYCNWPKSNDFEKLSTIIDDTISSYTINKDKIAVLGHSQGGAGTLALLAERPNFFSVGLPMSPAGTGQYQNTDYTTPMWFFVAKDEYPNINKYVDTLTKNLVSKGRNIRWTRMNHTGHETDDFIFRMTNIVDWIISQTKGQPVVFDENIEKQLGKYYEDTYNG